MISFIDYERKRVIDYERKSVIDYERNISIQLYDPCSIGKLSIRRVKLCNFTRIGCKTEEQERPEVQKMTLRDMVTVLCVGPDKSGKSEQV